MREIFLFANFSPHEIKTFKKETKNTFTREKSSERCSTRRTNEKAERGKRTK